MEKATIGVIGGSGLYQIENLKDLREIEVSTPFGLPSDNILLGTLEGKRMAFLPRHGRGHRLSPSEINFRANIYALKSLGVEFLLSVSAVGSMREDKKPGDLVVVDQFFDRTKSRPSTFFEDGIVAHIAFADPICPHLAKIVYDTSVSLGYTTHRQGTYLCMEGPQFSTRGESMIYRSWGIDVIGMTNIPEAKLAREAEICYATMAMVTDYDCWHESEEDVSVEMIIQTLLANVEKAKAIITKIVPILPYKRDCQCATALANAIITSPDAIGPETRKKLDLLIGERLPS